jgi:hypothetical protein
MDLNMKFAPTLLLSLLGFSSLSFAQEIIIYRWVDGNNVVHFSQNQPKHDDYTEISMQQLTHNKPSTNAAQTPATITNEEDAKKISEKSSERCAIAKNNLATLEKFDLIQYKTATGDMKILSAKEKKDQLELNKQQVDLFCKEQ